MTKGGFDWHHRELHNVTRPARGRGTTRYCPIRDSTPGTSCEWVAARPGCCSDCQWIRDTASKTVSFELAGILPEEVDLQLEAWLYDEWWLGHEGRFETSDLKHGQ